MNDLITFVNKKKYNIFIFRKHKLECEWNKMRKKN